MADLTNYTGLTCEPGMWLPVAGEFDSDNKLVWPRGLLMVLYLVGMLWSFMGVGIIADVFMEAIETITATTKTVKGPDGKDYDVKIWNETIANLTLMALGSSAPEIMLSVFGIMGTNYYAEELGPSTIVGSAAFNLLMIIAYCIIGIPPADGDTETGIRKISDMSVYSVTAFFSVFAYLWLLIILMLWTPDVVTTIEGTMTFLFFPIVVGIAFAADRNWFGADKIQPNAHIIGFQGHEFRAYEAAALLKTSGKGIDSNMNATETAAFLTKMAMAQAKPSRAQLRINAMRQLTGGKRVVPKDVGKASDYVKELPTVTELEEKPEVNFASGEYSVLESGGVVTVSVVRIPAKGTFNVKYATEGVTATAGQDFEAVSGTLNFVDGEEEKEISIKIKDDDEVEDDETFLVKLSEPSYGVIGPFGSTEVTIIDDDEPGEIGFKEKDASINTHETAGTLNVVISRFNGSAGEIGCKWSTKDGSAVAGTDYIANSGEITFKSGEISKIVHVGVIDTSSYEKNADFTVNLTDFNGHGDRSKGFNNHLVACKVSIVTDEAAKALVDDVTKMMNANMEQYQMGNGTYMDQFKEAFEVGCEDGETPTTADYVMHVINFPFKIVYAIVPPASWAGGWVCFFAALTMVGVTTIVIGDIAALFGCVFGLDKGTTAITFVALGTSLPDTFASKSAAVGDDTADAAIGNVTGSNAVNVFLGLGLPWMMAAFKWSGSGPDEDWYEKYGTPYVDETFVTRYDKSVHTAKTSDNVFWMPGNDKQGCTTCASLVELDSAAFIMPQGSLGFSVVVFCSCAMGCFAILAYRRSNCGGELGGPMGPAKVHAAMLVMLWFTYIGLSIMKNSGVI
jgi:solute carrier family 8 (sodium/calcium exchanger)